MDHEFYYVQAVDGAEKRWTWDGRPYRLAAGETRALPRGAAEVAFSFFTPRTGQAEEPCSTVKIWPCDDPVELNVVQVRKFTDPETGQEFDTLHAMVEAVKARATGGRKTGDGGPATSPVGLPPRSPILSGQAAGQPSTVTKRERSGVEQ